MPDFFHPHTALLRPPGGTYRSARANVRTGLVLVLLLLTALYVATSAPRADAAAPATASIVTTQPAATTAAIADVSGVTAATIDAYLGGVRSPMAGQGAAFVTAGAQWSIDPRFLVAISGAESSFGSITCARFNGWGYGCPNHPFTFISWADAINTIAQGLRTNYLDQGRTTVSLVQQKWAPSNAANDPTGLNNYWIANVTKFLVEQGGDPSRISLAPGDTTMASSLALSAGVGTAGVQGDLFGATTAPQTSVNAAGASTTDEPPVAQPDAPARLLVEVTNSGSATWSAANVRLRRVDVDPHLSSPPWGTLVENEVAPGAKATFQVDLAATGTDVGSYNTVWRVEGPTGPFANEITRVVSVQRSGYSAQLVSVVAPTTTIARDAPATVVVRLRNVGTETWTRTGDTAVALGVQASTGPTRFVEGRWSSITVPTSLLERSVAPGETASFAFPLASSAAVTGTSTLTLAAFTANGWVAMAPVSVSITSL